MTQGTIVAMTSLANAPKAPITPMDWRPVSAHRCALGESPFWHPHEQTLYWVDIAQRQVARANIYMGTIQTWDLPSEPGCIAPVLGGGLVLALRDGIFRAAEWGGALARIAQLPYDPNSVRANDGRCDALGRFWIGTVDEAKSHNAAGLYCVDARQGAVKVSCHAEGALTANGLEWSPDRRTLYWSDTPRHLTYAWDYSEPEPRLSNRRVFQSFETKPANWSFPDPGYQGRPDGAAVDLLGNYYVAMYEGARVCKFAPDGRLLAAIPTPVACPTMPCFGGEDGRTLFLTSASKGRSDQELTALPLSGAILQTRVAVGGASVHFFVQG